jgi:hypothetical protein
MGLVQPGEKRRSDEKHGQRVCVKVEIAGSENGVEGFLQRVCVWVWFGIEEDRILGSLLFAVGVLREGKTERKEKS